MSTNSKGPRLPMTIAIGRSTAGSTSAMKVTDSRPSEDADQNPQGSTPKVRSLSVKYPAAGFVAA